MNPVQQLPACRSHSRDGNKDTCAKYPPRILISAMLKLFERILRYRLPRPTGPIKVTAAYQHRSWCKQSCLVSFLDKLSGRLGRRVEPKSAALIPRGHFIREPQTFGKNPETSWLLWRELGGSCIVWENAFDSEINTWVLQGFIQEPVLILVYANDLAPGLTNLCIWGLRTMLNSFVD